MSEKKHTAAEKEIDLLEVSGKVVKATGKGLSKLLDWLISFILYSTKIVTLMVKAWKLLVLLAIIAGGVAYALYKINAPFYKSETFAISQAVENREIIPIINAISIPNDYAPIARRNDLQLPPEVYNNIIQLRASWLIDTDKDSIGNYVDYSDKFHTSPKDTLTQRIKDYFNIRMIVTDPGIIDEVQTALISFIENHPFIKGKNNSRLNEIQSMVSVYESQASVLDSLQNNEYFQSPNNNIQSLKVGEFEIIGTAEDRKLYYRDIIRLKENVVKSKTKITYENDALVLMSAFTNPTKPINNLSFYINQVTKIAIPIALLIFSFLKRKELDEILHVRRFIENKVTSKN